MMKAQGIADDVGGGSAAAPTVAGPGRAGAPGWQRRRLLGVPLAAWIASTAKAAEPMPAAAAAKPRRFGDMVGLGIKFSQGQPLAALAQLTELRVRWVREAVWWPQIEPSPGRYVDFTPTLQRQLAFYREHDIGLVALLTIENAKAYAASAEDPTRPYDPQAFGRFARQVATMLRAAGVRFVLEIGNEPHNSAFAKKLGGAWTGKGPARWVQHYVRMAQAAVEQVKAFDPRIRLLTDDDLWVVHYWYLEAGLPAALDGFAIHPYTPGPPERAAVAHDTDWVQPFRVVDPDRSFGSAVRRLREQGRQKLGHTPELWITEWGWAVDGAAHSVPDATLVAYLPRAYVLAAAAGVEVLCWFSAQDSVDGPMGLTRNDGTPRDSYRAFATMTAQLGEQHLLRQVAGSATPTAGLQAFLFDGPRGRLLVAWSADGRGRRLAPPAGAAPPRAAVDALGRLLSGPEGLEVAAAPIYLQADWSDADLDALAAASA